MEELLKKYEVLFRGADAAFQHKTVEFNSKVQKVYQNKLLAAAVMLKHNDDEEAVTPETKPGI